MKPIRGFVEECCLMAPNAYFPAIELYLTYVRWCLAGGVPVHDQYTFLEALENQGLEYRERRQRSWFKGVSVRPEHRIHDRGRTSEGRGR
jgi:phage/plasmid-associated DNA primase